METAHLEVILDAVNRGEGTMRSFGHSLQIIQQALERLGPAAKTSEQQVESSFSRMVNAARQAGTQMESSFRTVAGHGSMIGNAFSRVGGVLTAMWVSPLGALAGFVSLAASGLGAIVGAVGHVVGEIAHLGLEIVTWIGEHAVEAAKKAALAIAGIGAAATAATVGLGIMGIKAAAEMEGWTLQFSILLGSMQAAKEEMAKLRELAGHLPFKLTELVEADRMLKTWQIDLGGTEATLRTFADVAKAYGVGLEEVIRVYGRLQAGMFSQRLMVGVGLTMPRMEAAGAKFSGAGKVEGEASSKPEMLTTTALKVWSAVAGTAAAAMESMGGKLTNLADAWHEMMIAVGNPLLEGAKVSIVALSAAISTLEGPIGMIYASFAQAFGPVLAQALEAGTALVAHLGETLEEIAKSDRWRTFLATIAEVFSMAGQTVASWLNWLMDNWGTAWDWVANKVDSAAKWISKVLGEVVGAIKALVGSREAVAAWGMELGKVFFKIGQDLVTGVVNELVALFEVVKDHLKGAAAIIGALKGVGMAVSMLTVGALAGTGVGLPVAAGIVLAGGAAGATVGARTSEWAGGKIEDTLKALRDRIEKDAPTMAKSLTDKLKAELAKAGPFPIDLVAAIRQGGTAGEAAYQAFKGRVAARVEAPEFSFAKPLKDAADKTMEAAEMSLKASQTWEEVADALNPKKQIAAETARMAKAMGDVGGEQKALADLIAYLDNLAAQIWGPTGGRIDEATGKVLPAGPQDIQGITAMADVSEQRDKAYKQFVAIMPSEHAAREMLASTDRAAQIENFSKWYQSYAEATGTNPNPMDPRHGYDTFAYWQQSQPPPGYYGEGAQWNEPDQKVHLPDTFKTIPHEGAPTPDQLAARGIIVNITGNTVNDLETLKRVVSDGLDQMFAGEAQAAGYTGP